MSPATLAHGELQAFLSARAVEFVPGGLFTMAFISRGEDDAPTRKSLLGSAHPGLSKTHSAETTTRSQPATPHEHSTVPLYRERSMSSPSFPTLPKRDVWTILSGILGKAIQRLVSTQLLKPAVARQLLSTSALPLISIRRQGDTTHLLFN